MGVYLVRLAQTPPWISTPPRKWITLYSRLAAAGIVTSFPPMAELLNPIERNGAG